jgi:hypothetical protein
VDTYAVRTRYVQLVDRIAAIEDLIAGDHLRADVWQPRVDAMKRDAAALEADLVAAGVLLAQVEPS